MPMLGAFLGERFTVEFCDSLLVLVGACGCKAYVSNVLTKMSWGHFGSSETGVCWEQIGRKVRKALQTFLADAPWLTLRLPL